MRAVTKALCSLLTLSVFAHATSPQIYREHERRSSSEHWRKEAPADLQAVVPVRIGLKQQNLDQGAEWLREISDPTSAKYGQHWSTQKLIETFRPSNETFRAVHQWLADSGIDRTRTTVDHSHWIEFNASISEVQQLLKAEYHIFKHAISDNDHLACDSYSLPGQLADHVDFITPTVHFDRPLQHRALTERGTKGKIPKSGPKVGSVYEPPLPKPGPRIDVATTGYSDTVIANQVKSNTASCVNVTSTFCLRYLYSIPINYQANSQNSFGIVEYAPNNYKPSDNTNFYTQYSARQIGTQPILDSVDGGALSTFSASNEGEPSLDFQVANLAWPQQSTLFQVGGNKYSASFGNFLDAIDASYCTYSGGDTPGIDTQFPNTDYPHAEMCGKYSPPNVLSTSYGYEEYELGYAYASRQCYEYMKLGLAGTTVIYSSGDSGVAGAGNYCNNGASQGSGSFEPTFPSTCPFVTSVGSTQIQGNTNIGVSNVQQPEQATNAFGSGGGFSNFFSVPTYQASAVSNYYANYAPSYSAAQYNNSQQVRGFPDVAASGYNFITAIAGNFYLVSGTSMSCPVFASIITLINQERLNAGKSTVGFVNPALYANSSIMNDITVGNNPGCGTSGFSAVPGWDPVSGLGTPKYPAMLAYFMSLP